MQLRKPVFRIYTEGLAVKPPALLSDPADGGPAGRLRLTRRLPPLQPGARVESSFCLCRLGSWVLLRLPQEMGPAPQEASQMWHSHSAPALSLFNPFSGHEVSVSFHCSLFVYSFVHA